MSPLPLSPQVGDTPGPGAYDASLSPSGPMYTMSGHTGSPPREGFTPGPGAYDVAQAHGGGFTMAGRLTERMVEGGPGPGAYDPKSPEAAKGVTMSGRPTTSPKLGDTPGPGAYDVVSPSREGVTMTGRHPDRPGDDLPGPGAYDPSLKPTGPQYSMSGRTGSPSKVTAPLALLELPQAAAGEVSVCTGLKLGRRR